MISWFVVLHFTISGVTTVLSAPPEINSKELCEMNAQIIAKKVSDHTKQNVEWKCIASDARNI